MAVYSVDKYWVVPSLILLVQVPEEQEDSRLRLDLDALREILVREPTAPCRSDALEGNVW